MSLGLYVHLPFCRVRCTYCAFAVSTDVRLEDRYGEALLAEIRARLPEGSSVDTIYWGGGTPSLTSPEWLRRIDGALRARISPDPAAEVTLEANPEDVSPSSVDLWRSVGVNRLSIGVQSMHEAELIPLGRLHGRARALEAIRLAHAGGFRVSLDLILGLPGQTRDSFLESLEIALAEGAGHLSMYVLDLEPASALEGRVTRGLTSLPEDEMVADLYAEAIGRIESAGLRQYEISNFARAGEESRHNLRYWDRKPYLGLGAGAHSFDGVHRRGNQREVSEYIAAINARGTADDMTEKLTPEEERHEWMFLSLRRTGGIGYSDLLQWSEGKGKAWCKRGLSEGWLHSVGEKVAFTSRGFLLSNELISELF